MLTFEYNILDPDFKETTDALRSSIRANKEQLDRLGGSYDIIFENMNRYNKNKDNGN